MKVKSLNRGEAHMAMEEWISNWPSLPRLDTDFEGIRKDIQEMNKNVRKRALEDGIKGGDYYIDAHLGLALYEYLQKMPWFTMRVAADDGFWRYLSLIVVPNVVAQRWGKENSDHYWRKPSRIWLRSIWWYIHLAWQGDIESTQKVVENNRFTTDTILNFVERSGRKGTCIEAYRHILYMYSKIDDDTIRSICDSRKMTQESIFRTVMKLNTARMMVMDPALCMGGEEAYAKSLFEDVGFTINVT